LMSSIPHNSATFLHMADILVYKYNGKLGTRQPVCQIVPHL